MLKILAYKSLFLAASIALGAQQWTPVVAKVRTRESRVAPDGSEIVVGETHGFFLRASTGAQLSTSGRLIDGVPQDIARATFFDASGKQYELSYNGKLAVLKGSGPTLRPELTPEYLAKARNKAVGEKTINGVHCLAFPVISGESGSVTGRGWMSVEHQLHVKLETDSVVDGQRRKFVRELYDIQLGVEPPAELMVIPPDFNIVNDTKDLPTIAP